jgi:hypothetical protein
MQVITDTIRFWVTLWALSGFAFIALGYYLGINHMTGKLFSAQDENAEMKKRFKEFKQKKGWDILEGIDDENSK